MRFADYLGPGRGPRRVARRTHSNKTFVLCVHWQVLAQALDVIQARLANRTLLSAEFRHVMQLDESITHSVDDSQLPSHLPLNRYWNILP